MCVCPPLLHVHFMVNLRWTCSKIVMHKLVLALNCSLCQVFLHCFDHHADPLQEFMADIGGPTEDA